MKLQSGFVVLLLAATGTFAQEHREAKLAAERRQQALSLLEQAAQLPVAKDSPSRLMLTSQIAQGLFRAGAVEKSAAVLREALNSLPHTETPTEQAESLLQIASEQDAVGNRRGTADIIERLKPVMALIADETDRQGYYADAASLQVKAGDLEGAWQTLEALPVMDSRRLDEVGEIAADRVRSGDLDGALRLARTPLGDQASTEAAEAIILRHIVSAQIAAGNLSGALDTARSVPRVLEKAQALADIAVAQYRAGEREAAAATFVEAGKDPTSLHEIARAHAETGEFASALATIDSGYARPSDARTHLLLEVAAVAIKSRQRDTAGKLLDKAASSALASLDGDARSNIMQRICGMRAEASDFAAAVAMAGALPEAWQRGALDKIAAEEAKAGNIAEAEQIARQSGARHLAYREIVLARARKGDVHGALRDSVIADLTQQIIRERANSGDVAAGTEYLATQHSGEDRAMVLLAIAQGLLDASKDEHH